MNRCESEDGRKVHGRRQPLADALGAYAAKRIRLRAGQLIGRYGFSPDDREDLEHDLALDLLQRLSRFDPSRASLNTFVSRVVDHAVATIVERQTAAGRDARLTTLFSDCVMYGERGKPASFEDGITTTDYLRMTGRVDSESPRNVSLRAALERASESLSTPLQGLVHLLAEGFSISEISRRAGIPRSTVYDRVREIRAHFDRIGLRIYL